MRVRSLIGIVAVLHLASPVSAWAAFESVPVGARPAGLAGAFVAIADDANSPVTNPAGMSQLHHPELTSFYAALYGVDGLARTMLSVAIPTPVGGLGLSYDGFGNDLYRETTVGLSYSHSLASRLMLGITARELLLSIHRYGTAHVTAVDAGGLLRLPGQVRVGAIGRNINRALLAGSRDQIPRTISVGVSRAGPRVVVAAQIDRESGRPVCGRIGQEFRLAQAVVVRSGIVTDPSMFFAGASVVFPHVEASYAVSSHPVLGLTHQVSLTLGLGKRRR